MNQTAVRVASAWLGIAGIWQPVRTMDDGRWTMDEDAGVVACEGRWVFAAWLSPGIILARAGHSCLGTATRLS